jgi:hypothetical protein
MLCIDVNSVKCVRTKMRLTYILIDKVWRRRTWPTYFTKIKLTTDCALQAVYPPISSLFYRKAGIGLPDVA